MITAYQKTGLRCVVLIDEYDKPLLDLIDNPKLQEHNKAVFKGFFSNLKNCDEYLRFVFITGVTKFHKVSIFSDLNQLNDISLNEEFSEICGITEEELKNIFLPEVTAISQKQKIDETTCLEMLKTKYDGYHFFVDSVGVYNPFSLLKAFYEEDLALTGSKQEHRHFLSTHSKAIILMFESLLIKQFMPMTAFYKTTLEIPYHHTIAVSIRISYN